MQEEMKMMMIEPAPRKLAVAASFLQRVQYSSMWTMLTRRRKRS